ncbi:two-component system response regulator [Salegentibacter salinarum]|uniref:Two-component system response regulator n=1 Tax=Salegentibacter salinarum TaxID=447422 RepID=A0A2N0TPK5_9FLAO|nr:response regulator transcription factor [Salegentibacter salinarum]PKD16669.1 two-component system response regulator [Salegentibacter salinarum]SKB61035.1 two component transcriptional regulator, LuxR family [Salegentibacter salinarum]
MNNTVAIVDDHTLFAQSLKNLVNSFENYEVSGIYKNGQELVEQFKANKPKPHLVLLDIRMPIMNGPETMAWLKENHPNQKVLALTMEDDEETVTFMVKLGCRGYLLKDIDPDEFKFALDEVVKEGFFYTDAVSEAIKNRNKEKKFTNLTKREIEFLELACTEMTYKEVANEMNLSPKTIDGYRESLFQKLNVKSRTGLVLYAIKHRILLL